MLEKKKKKRTEIFNEDYIQAQMKESGLSHTEVKALLDTTLYESESDFTDDAEKGSPKRDGSGKGSRANKGRGIPEEKKGNSEEKEDKEIWIKRWMIDDEITRGDAEKRYDKSFSASDFTSDAGAYNYNLLRELADSWKIFATERGEKARRAHQLFRELFVEIEKKLNELDKLKKKSDFTDDTKNSFYHKLNLAMTQLNTLLDSPKLWDMLEKLTESERTVLYNHPLAKTNSQLLP